MRPLTLNRSVLAVAALVGSTLPASAVLAGEPPAPPIAPNEAAATSSGYFHPLDPARILDTREGVGATGAVGPGQRISLQVTGNGGVPEGAGAVVLNVTAVAPTDHGFVAVHPTGAERPTVSNLNFAPGQVVPNLVIARVGDDGQVDLFNSAGETHLVADVMGWYDDLVAAFPEVPEGGSRQRALSPTRLLDTRDLGAPVGPDSSIELQVAGTAGIPNNATAVVLNVTVTQPSAAGYITVHPTGTDRPTASNLNFLPGQTVPNLVIAKIGEGGKVRLYNSHGSSHLVADATAYFEPASELLGGGELTSANPARVLDTRLGHGGPDRKVGPGETISFDVTGVAGTPESRVAAVVLNVTVTEPTAHGYVTVHPSGEERPTASNLNFTPGLTVPNLVIAKVGSDGNVSLFNSDGETHLIADIAGWFAADHEASAIPPPDGGDPGDPTGEPAGGGDVAMGTASQQDPGFAANQAAFWSVNDPEKILASATPEPLMYRGGEGSDSMMPSAEPREFDLWSKGYTYPSYNKKIGRLVYWIPTERRWSSCTATMVARNLALTAAHCVVKGQNFQHFAFFAGLSDNYAYGGIFTNVIDTVYPTVSGQPAYLDHRYGGSTDYAFVKFGLTDQRYPGDIVGWYGMKARPQSLRWLLSFGYPAEGSYFERNCTTPQTQMNARCYLYHNWGRYGGWNGPTEGWYEIGWGSNMSGGSSGGPVFAKEDGTYRIVSVNSHGRVAVCDIWVGRVCVKRAHVYNMWGPYFNDFMLKLHRSHRA